MTYYNWLGYTGPQAEPIAEARLIEAARNVLGNQLPTPALICAGLAELLRGGIGVGSGSVSGFYSPSGNSVPSNGTSDAVAAMTTFLTNVVPASGGPYYVVLSPGETYKFSSDFTFPANVRLYSLGGTLKPDSGKKITLAAEPFATGKMFDTGAGGTVVAGSYMTVKPEWWGAWPSGAGDATIDPASYKSAFLSLATTGGRVLMSQLYLTNTYIDLVGEGFYNITTEGVGNNAGFLHTINGADTSKATIMVRGAGAATLTHGNLTWRNIVIRGNSGTLDIQKMFLLGNIDTAEFDHVRIYDGAVEGIYSGGGSSTINLKAHHCYASNVGNGGQKLSAFNLNGHNCTVEDSVQVGCGMLLENAGDAFLMSRNRSYYPTFECHALVASTWSADYNGGLGPEHDYAVVLASGNYFEGPGVAFITGDSGTAGHTDHGHAVHGNAGKFLITGNECLNTSGLFSGGADQFNQVVIQDNYGEGNPGSQNNFITADRGRFTIKGNTIRQGAEKYANIISCGVNDPVNTSGVIENNTIVGDAWTGSAILYSPDVIVSRNIFTANTAGRRYALGAYLPTSNGILSGWIPGTDPWLSYYDSDLSYSMYQPSRIRVIGTFPNKGSWKYGDRAINVGLTGAPGWFCLTSGTADTLDVSVTISTTSASKNFTVTAGLPLIAKYQFITIPGVTGVKQLATYDPATGLGTFDTNASATVTSATPLYSPPTWMASNDLTYAQLPGQQAGDLWYAVSPSIATRLPIPADGYYLGVNGGFPTWQDAIPRYDAGPSGASITLTRTPARQEQKLTLSANATVTIDKSAIPSGGYLVADVYQDNTGSRTLAWAVSTGTISWVNGGVAPTMTPTANKYDRYIFHNNGSTALQAWAAFQNAT